MPDNSKVDNTEAKKDVPAVVATGTALAVAPDVDMFLEDAGSGLEHVSTQDMMVPYLNILQQLSPQCAKRESSYIEGAEPGHFFNTATQEIFDGEKGVYVIPVTFQRRITEWVPRNKGGGLVRDWGQDDSPLRTVKRDPATGMDLTPDGNQVTQAGTHYVLVVDPETGSFERAVVSMSGTQLKKSRRWNTLISSIQVDKPGGGKFTPAAFYMVYHLTTVPESNDKGSWMGYSIRSFKPTVELPGGRDIYLAGKAFRDAINEGLVKSAPEQHTESDVETPF